MTSVLTLPFRFIVRFLPALEQAFLHITQPARHLITISTIADLTRSKAELTAENALLRQQLIILHRQVKKPSFTPSDRLSLVLLVSRVKSWKAFGYTTELSVTFPTKHENALAWAGLTYVARHFCGIPCTASTCFAWRIRLSRPSAKGSGFTR